MQKPENGWNPGTWVLIREYSARAIQWIPTWQGLDGFQNSLDPCALYESSLSIGRVNSDLVTPTYVGLCSGTIPWHRRFPNVFCFHIHSYSTKAFLSKISPPILHATKCRPSGSGCNIPEPAQPNVKPSQHQGDSSSSSQGLSVNRMRGVVTESAFAYGRATADPWPPRWLSMSLEKFRFFVNFSAMVRLSRD